MNTFKPTPDEVKSQAPVILIVDDNLKNLHLLGKILRDKGYQPVMVQSGAKALAFIEKHTPDLILLDIMMPEMDGFDVCRHLKNLKPLADVPVIFVTALNEISDKLRAFRAGGVDFITKPFIQEEVLARVNVHVQLKQALEQLRTLAATDDLTGVFNRRSAHDILQQQMTACNLHQACFTVCYLDVDNLKTINDLHGHDVGDEVLNIFVRTLESEIRASDYVVRVGGDEFLLIFPGVRIDDARQILERVQHHLDKCNVCGRPIGFSSGYCEFHAGDNYTVEDLISHADTEMYRVKHHKKNQQHRE